ncbi:MAG: precorrin-3B C(17)-methyltransferase [Clostridium sp.]|nr:precorrin-3B C(17)-methyltransferase [Clostridium sp.]
MGKLYVVGIGPGDIDNMTINAKRAIEESSIIVGYTKYIALIKDIIKDKEIFSTGMRGEVERCQKALELSRDKTVAIISSGDAGIYGMAGLILEMRKDEEVIIVPGVTASIASASLLGAPLMHDSCNISLSDLMTPYDLIKKRVKLAAEGDFVISLYNPRSMGRQNYLKECIDIIAEYRNSDTPIGIVKNALRKGQDVKLCTISTFDKIEKEVGMLSTVIIGNSTTYIKDGKMITKRGYKL